MSDRVQNVWLVEVIHENELGQVIHGGRKGVLEPPYPMTAFDAADYAIRCEIRDAFDGANSPRAARSLHAVVWSSRDKGRASGRYQVCGALAEFMKEEGRFMRATPWFDQGPTHETVGAADGAVFHPLDWH